MEAPKIELTERAQEMFVQYLQDEDNKDLAIALAVTGYGAKGFEYQLDVIDASSAPESLVVDQGDFRILVEPKSVEFLDGVSIDFVQEGLSSGFRFQNPNKRWQDPVANALQELFDQQINVRLADHGGWVELIGYREQTAYVSLGGGCQGCGMAKITLKSGIEAQIREAIPEVEGVVDVTDHAAGENPFFSSEDGSSPFG